MQHATANSVFFYITKTFTGNGDAIRLCRNLKEWTQLIKSEIHKSDALLIT